jgi:hypothetical protein
MSGLDSSQRLTDEASLHAEQFHVHSHPERAQPDDEAEATASPADEAQVPTPDDE